MCRRLPLSAGRRDYAALARGSLPDRFEADRAPCALPRWLPAPDGGREAEEALDRPYPRRRGPVGQNGCRPPRQDRAGRAPTAPARAVEEETETQEDRSGRRIL